MLWLWLSDFDRFRSISIRFSGTEFNLDFDSIFITLVDQSFKSQDGSVWHRQISPGGQRGHTECDAAWYSCIHDSHVTSFDMKCYTVGSIALHLVQTWRRSPCCSNPADQQRPTKAWIRYICHREDHWQRAVSVGGQEYHIGTVTKPNNTYWNQC